MSNQPALCRPIYAASTDDNKELKWCQERLLIGDTRSLYVISIEYKGNKQLPTPHNYTALHNTSSNVKISNSESLNTLCDNNNSNTNIYFREGGIA
jgi:hypothetical protein